MSFCFDTIFKTRSWHTVLMTDSSLIGFLNAFLCSSARSQSLYTCLVSNNVGLCSGELMSQGNSSYFLISDMPPTLLFHHMVISCFLLKWGMWMFICQPSCYEWSTKSNLPDCPLPSWGAASPRPQITLISFGIRSFELCHSVWVWSFETHNHKVQ